MLEIIIVFLVLLILFGLWIFIYFKKTEYPDINDVQEKPELARIKLINEGHADKCAKRMVYGDGICTCRLKYSLNIGN